MNPNKDFFELFRESAQQLDEAPSRHAWRKLENRLDTHQNKGRTSLYRTLAMAAAVIALVAFTFVISMMVQTQQLNDQMAEVMGARPNQLEDLSTYNDGTEEAYKIHEFTRRHTSRLSNPVSDGQPGKKLLASYTHEDAHIRPAVVLGSKASAVQKEMMLRNVYFKSFKSLLLSKEVKAFFAGKPKIYLWKTESLCAAVACETFKLEQTGQDVIFYTREDLFMRRINNWMKVEAKNTSADGTIDFSYTLNKSTE